MELLGERIGLEGQRQQLRVPCEAPGITDPFQSLLSCVAQMRELVTEFFGSQVQPEAQDWGTAAPDEALDDDSEDENNTDNRTNSDGPSAKRQKPS
uniref:Uncharacterized protein n=1 Tax=Ovis aries TaxID=9940 RepID=A0AC11AKS2_SHEEP